MAAQNDFKLLNIPGLDNPSVNEFLLHPDL
jgi:hypothetical protein